MADMRLPCFDSACKIARKDHPDRERSGGASSSSSSSSSSFRMPSKETFPKFRDSRDRMMSDPHEFLVLLDRTMQTYNVPADKYAQVLVMCVADRLMQDHIEKVIIPSSSSWTEVKRQFSEKYTDPALKDELMRKFGECAQRTGERVYQYTERYHSLAVRLYGDKRIDNQTNIISCEQGLQLPIRQQLALYRAAETQKLNGVQFEFTTLTELYKAAAGCEQGLAPRPARTSVAGERAAPRRQERKYRGGARVYNVQQEQDGAAVAKIEIGSSGQPVNTSKQQNKRKHVTFASSATPDSSSSRGGGILKYQGGRGGVSRGGGPRGGARGAYRGRGGAIRIDGSATQYHTARGGHSVHPDRHAQHRGQNNGAAPRTASFDGECYNCHKHGHRARDCPNG
jgi:hypothetical protein